MSARINQTTGPCCGTSVKGYRLLVFPDGSQAGIIGLDKIFDDAYSEKKRPHLTVAAAMVRMLSENNYIASSQRPEYEAVVLGEYQKFYEAREKNGAGNVPRSENLEG
jgi:hypothetical protein